MSDLYHVRVEAVSHKTRSTPEALTLRVTTIHPDAGPPPAEGSFIMAILWDLWRDLEGSQFWPYGTWVRRPDHPPEQVALAMQEPWASVMLRVRALLFGFQQPATEEQIAWWRSKEGAPDWKRKIAVKPPGAHTRPFKVRCEVREDSTSPTGYMLVHTSHPYRPLSDVGSDQVTRVEAQDPRNYEHHDAQADGEMFWPKWPAQIPGESWEQRLTRLPSVTLYATFKQKDFLGFVTPGVEIETAAYE